jgi:hypothetical protein
MANDVTLPAQGTGTATPVVATDNDGARNFQYVKIVYGADGVYTKVGAASTGNQLPVRGEGRFIEAAFGTLTRPANTTAYSSNDAVSNNATAGSVTAQTATVADANDNPIAIERIRVSTNDTGPGVAGIAFQAWVFQSDPTASSGVGGGDNAAFSQKRAGLIGTFTGLFFPTSDGSFAVLTPDQGVRAIAKPVSGAATLFVVWKTLGPFTPSANSTTYVATIEGFQGRA